MVAMNTWPTDGAAGSVANEARWRSMARMWMPSAVAGATALAPSLAGTNLTIKAGACWVDGHYCELTNDQVLTVTANGLAVVRFDPAANTADLVYRDAVSSPAQSPTGTWELPVAKITASALVDVRAILLADGGIAFATAAGRDFTWPAATTPKGSSCLTLDLMIRWVNSGSAWGAIAQPSTLQAIPSGWTDPGTIASAVITLAPSLTIAAAPFARIANVHALVHFGTVAAGGATDYTQCSILQDGATGRSLVRGYGTLGAIQQLARFTLPANTGTTLACTVQNTGTRTCTIIAADARYGIFSALLTPA